MARSNPKKSPTRLKQLADRWVEQYDLRDKTVLEIGCGKGEFLVMMAEAGAGHCIGIDPGVHPERIESPAADHLEWIVDFYSESYEHLAADAVVCRHTLEHIPDVEGFLSMIRSSLGDRTDTIVLFELPDIQRILDETAFWDLYFEHCSYFSAGSLARLFRRCGFEVLSVSREYDDQYLLVEARPAGAGAARDLRSPSRTISPGCATVSRSSCSVTTSCARAGGPGSPTSSSERNEW